MSQRTASRVGLADTLTVSSNFIGLDLEAEEQGLQVQIWGSCEAENGVEGWGCEL